MTGHDFECDLEPGTHQPRVRFNFANGWSASLLIRTGTDLTNAMMASVACCPTGRWQDGVTELGPIEAFGDEAIAWLAGIALRPAPGLPLAIRCPTCQAPPGQKCRTIQGDIDPPHAARVFAADALKGEENS